jgi:hypothetical protein
MTVGDELTKLNGLREEGVLSEEEFQTQKERILAGQTAAGTRNKDASSKVPNGEKSKSKLPLILGLSIGIPLLALAILLPIMLSGPSADLETTESLGQSVIEVIANNDRQTFREFYLKEEDREWALQNIPKAAKKPERLDKWIAEANAKSLEEWFELREHMEKDGVDPSSLEFNRVVEDDCRERKGVFKCDDITVFAKSNVGEVKFKIDDPIKTGRGWIVGDYLKYKSRKSELHQRADALVIKACACAEDAKCKLDAAMETLKLAKEISAAADKAAAESLAKLRDCK